MNQKHQIKRRQVVEGNATGESRRLRMQQQIEEAGRRAEEARRIAEDARRRDEDVRRRREEAEMEEQWKDNNDEWISGVEASARHANSAVGDLTQRVDRLEERTKTVEGQVGDLDTQQHQGYKNLDGRTTNVEGRVREIGDLQNHQNEENKDLKGRLANIEAGQVTTNNEVAALESKQRDMDAQVGQLKNVMIGVAIVGGILIAGFIIKAIFRSKGKEKRDKPSEKAEGNYRRHARKWDWSDEVEDW